MIIAVPDTYAYREPDVTSPRRCSLTTRFESWVRFCHKDDDAEEIATPTRRFSLLEITSGLPDDSREADERAAEQRLRDLRGRVKAARATISAIPSVEAVLRHDWIRAARFSTRFGITERQFRRGVPPLEGFSDDDLLYNLMEVPVNTRAELRSRAEATFRR